MKSLPVLDIFILAALDREPASPYDLHRQLGVSLGASLPALRRLMEGGLVARTVMNAKTKRPRHEYRLKPAGKAALKSAWQPHLEDRKKVLHLDSILRLVDVGLRFGGDKKVIRDLLVRAAESRSRSARQANLEISEIPKSASRLQYASMKLMFEYERSLADASALRKLADQIKVRHDGHEQMALDTSDPSSD